MVLDKAVFERKSYGEGLPCIRYCILDPCVGYSTLINHRESVTNSEIACKSLERDTCGCTVKGTATDMGKVLRLMLRVITEHEHQSSAAQ